MKSIEDVLAAFDASVGNMTDPVTGKKIRPKIRLVDSENERDTSPDIFEDFSDALLQFKAYLADGHAACIHCVLPDEFEIELGLEDHQLWWVFEREEDTENSFEDNSELGKITLQALVEGGIPKEDAEDIVNKIPYSTSL